MILIDPAKVQLLFMSNQKCIPARVHTMPMCEVFTNDQVNSENTTPLLPF